MDENSKLVIIASKDILNGVDLALGEADCARDCIGNSFFNMGSVIEYGIDFALSNGYDVVALDNRKETFSGLKFDIDLEFYFLPEID